MTLVEMLVAVAIGTLVLAVVGTLFVTSVTSFAGIGNYAELTNESKLSLDRMSREMREATEVIGCVTNLPEKQLVLTNALQGKTITYTWDSTTELFTMELSGEPAKVYLTGCKSWNFSLFQRTPQASWGFFPTQKLALAKLINMDWKCARQLVTRFNTETVVTSQIVLRNKP